MADHNIPHFQNDLGYKTIEIGVKEFMCVGATQPFDHPHIFIDMGAADEKSALIAQPFIVMFLTLLRSNKPNRMFISSRRVSIMRYRAFYHSFSFSYLV